MPKNQMQDMVPRGRSIRNVPLSESRAREARHVPEETKAHKKEQVAEAEELDRKKAIRQAREEFETSRSARPPRRPRTANVDSTGGGKWLYICGGLVAVVILAFFISAAFHGATIIVTPKTQAFSADSDFTAIKNSASGSLSYSTINVSQSDSESVPANGQNDVQTKATGVITIYNNYSAAPQKLVASTRFSTPEGLIFRIASAVTVPGKKGATAGSVDATIVADQAGENYNVGLKDFAIPGFKGDPRYAGFYARSKTPLAGGFSGIQKVVSPSDRARAKTDIDAKLASALMKQAKSQVAADSIFFDNAYEIVYTALPDTGSSTNAATIREQGAIVAVTFNKEALSSALAQTYATGYAGDSIAVQSLSGLSFAPKNFDPANSSSISFHLTGKGVFEWLYSDATLKNALKGQSRSNTPAILAKFPMIQKADISIRPFWSRSFPTDLNKIIIQKATL